MGDIVDQDEDLPLSANFKQIQIQHYNLEMKCDFETHTFDSTLVLSIIPGPEWKEDTDLILDCSDIVVLDVRAVAEGGVYGNLTRSSESEKRLDFSLTKWALTICLPASDDFKERLESGKVMSVMITYKTLSNTRSLHWRQNCDGSPCVYTAAASINNRGLFPCQDVPGAMSTWSAVISLASKFTNHVVLCTGEQVPYISSEGNLRKYHFCHTSFVVPMSTFAIAVGLWEVREIECTYPLTRFIGK